MKILPSLEEVKKIAETGKYDVLPVSTEILSDFTTPIETMKIVKNVHGRNVSNVKMIVCLLKMVDVFLVMKDLKDVVNVQKICALNVQILIHMK